MLGGLYIADMLERFSGVYEHELSGDTGTGRYPGMHVTAAHYPTLQGIASALDIGRVYGIPSYASSLTFELLHKTTLAELKNDIEDFGIRIIYQEGVDEASREHLHVGIVDTTGMDGSNLNQRVNETGILPYADFLLLITMLVDGGPAFYEGSRQSREEAWCNECKDTESGPCARLHAKVATNALNLANTQLSDANTELEKFDGLEGYHLALMTILGLLLGISIGCCIR
ncbi:unnamed protein product, partial [Discosporangium mesarthrocarpum]